MKCLDHAFLLQIPTRQLRNWEFDSFLQFSLSVKYAECENTKYVLKFSSIFVQIIPKQKLTYVYKPRETMIPYSTILSL